MKLACLFGHKWNGCTCENCGKVRNEEHLYANFKAKDGKCVGRCKCGNTQTMEHDWQPIPGKCYKACSRCGTEREIEHTWAIAEGSCKEKCTVCGAEREKHNFVIGRCSRCGKKDPEAFMDECVEKLLQIFPITMLDYDGHARFDAAHRDEVRKIGEDLDKLGGMRAMRRVGEEFARQRPIHARKLETTWDGIGYWMG